MLLQGEVTFTRKSPEILKFIIITTKTLSKHNIVHTHLQGKGNLVSILLTSTTWWEVGSNSIIRYRELNQQLTMSGSWRGLTADDSVLIIVLTSATKQQIMHFVKRHYKLTSPVFMLNFHFKCTILFWKKVWDNKINFEKKIIIFIFTYPWRGFCLH